VNELYPSFQTSQQLLIVCTRTVKRGKVLPYSLPSGGSGADPGVQATQLPTHRGPGNRYWSRHNGSNWEGLASVSQSPWCIHVHASSMTYTEGKCRLYSPPVSIL